MAAPARGAWSHTIPLSPPCLFPRGIFFASRDYNKAAINTQKLSSQCFDGGEAFTFAFDCDTHPKWTVIALEVRPASHIAPEEVRSMGLFLVQHWCDLRG